MQNYQCRGKSYMQVLGSQLLESDYAGSGQSIAFSGQ